MAWETILHIKNMIKKAASDANSEMDDAIFIPSGTSRDSILDNYSILISFLEHAENANAADIHIKSSKPFLCEINYNRQVAPSNKQLFDLYTSYALLPFYARKLNKIYVVSHFAQTLDGRIASKSGDSKWIGNRENLVHAHRMRALLDGIMVGSKTLKADDPKLSVRHVAGDDPQKILIGGDNLDIDEYYISKNEFIAFNQGLKTKGRTFSLKKKNNLFNTAEILNNLKEIGIRSVYIEGGALTASSFLTQKAIDQVQVHFAPIILGSGITGFNFEGADHLEEAVYFKSFRYRPIGNQMMFIGELDKDEFI